MPPKKRSANGNGTNGASGDAAAPPAKLNRTDSDYDSMDLTSEVRGIVKNGSTGQFGSEKLAAFYFRATGKEKKRERGSKNEKRKKVGILGVKNN